MVVEDEEKIRTALGAALVARGHEVHLAPDGATALSNLIRDPPDLILLDLGLPDLDGSTLLTMVRSIGDISVIAVTARTEPDEIVRILDLGADDYVTKPFNVNQLVARIGAVLRRSDPEGRRSLPDTITVGGIVLTPALRQVTVDGAPVVLRHFEYELLLTLAMADGQLVPVDALIRRVWGPDTDLTEGAGRLDVQLSLLRSKLGETARHPRYLHRVRNLGARLTPPTGQ